MKFRTLKTLILTAFLFFAAQSLSAHPLPPPPEHGGSGDQPAPIGSGLLILAGLTAAYGAKKVYDARRKISE
ncbi:MAG: hypothetical protein RG741_11030 [Bacteroidales bacterium]|nr:hypothetical protein [Bacteroidales bacterium]